MKTAIEILYVSAFVVILLVCGGRGEDRSVRFDEELEKMRREKPDPITNLGLYDASGRLKPGVNPRRQLSRWEYRRTRIKYLDLVNEIQADHGLRKTPNADNWDGLIGDIAATEELMDEITSGYRAQKRNGNGGRPDSVATSSRRRTSGRASSHRRTSESTSSRRPASESTSSTRRGSSSTRESRRRRTKRTTITSDSNKYWPFNTPIQYIINGAMPSGSSGGEIQGSWEDNSLSEVQERAVRVRVEATAKGKKLNRTSNEQYHKESLKIRQ
ncbi:PREDICTED: uncharacterized protein LOC106817455 [Priapulus caudatus]|uniref:Uncharacterized protein LOC106817455 n=1 Tax=Priapulus caudatus TaxID=37621 RepID=A0ABM1EZI3_PRICU|nr:PREDICTED: uncharacterized protein LOC106817455 [Priapulus caudatus]